MIKKSSLKSTLVIFLALIMSFTLVACQDTGEEDNNNSEVNNVSDEEEEATPTPEASRREMGAANIGEIETYLNSIVNGPFREIVNFPDFTSVTQIPAIVISNGNLLRTATDRSAQTTISRQDYELFLQQYFNPNITLPSSANYQRSYDAENDQFFIPESVTDRNFFPETWWTDGVVSQEANTVYYDAYEYSYEFVNSGGFEETTNAISRIVVDDVTIGFSAPIVKRDLYLIDHTPLAKTRYEFYITEDNNLNLISKTKLERDEGYKASAIVNFEDVVAVNGQAGNLDGGTLRIFNLPSDEASLIGTLQESTYIWSVDLGDENHALVAPAARTGVFDYNLGFGYANKAYIN